MPSMDQLAGIRYDLLSSDCDAIVEAYRTGAPPVRGMFGLDVKISSSGWRTRLLGIFLVLCGIDCKTLAERHRCGPAEPKVRRV